MRLIFIRHGDPDYKNDNLTQKGIREVELLTKRVVKWFEQNTNDENSQRKIDIFCSPLGRAKATAAPSLKILNRKAEICSWLQEFHYKTKMPKTNEETMCWDLLPEFYVSDKMFFDKDNWQNSQFMKNGNIAKYYKIVCSGIDGILSRYGYDKKNKNGMIYKVKNPVFNPNFDSKIQKYHLTSVKNQNENTTLIFFCHLGVMFAIIAHLTGLSPMQLWQGFYVAPTSITIMNSEERIKGQAFFRVERLGDTSHLTQGNEKISSSGYFCDVLQEI